MLMECPRTYPTGSGRGRYCDVLLWYFVIISDVSVVFFQVSAMTIALYLIAYMLMYAAAIRLRYTKPNLARPFKMPGWACRHVRLTAGVGFVGVFFSFLVAFFPPDQLPVGSPGLYVTAGDRRYGACSAVSPGFSTRCASLTGSKSPQLAE